MERSTGIGALLRRMEGLLEPLEASRDPEWVERWDVAFADLYLDAVEDAQAGRRPPEPWAVAFGAGHGADGLPPLRHVLLGMNAHINYDLAQSLLAVISEPEFDDPGLLAARHADHEHIDQILVARVGAEDTELEALSGPAAAPTASSSPSTGWPPSGSCASPGPRSGPTPASWTPPAAPAPTPTPPAWPSWSAWPPPGSPT
jgi:Family of unknown function (DUF5995)